MGEATEVDKERRPPAIQRIVMGLAFGLLGAVLAIGIPLLLGIVAAQNPIVMRILDSITTPGGGLEGLFYSCICFGGSAVMGIAAGLFAGASHPRKSPRVILRLLTGTDVILILICLTNEAAHRLASLFGMSLCFKLLCLLLGKPKPKPPVPHG